MFVEKCRKKPTLPSLKNKHQQNKCRIALYNEFLIKYDVINLHYHINV